MSLKSTAIRDDLFDYLIENFSGENNILKEIKDNAYEQGIPQISISPEQLKFLQFLIKSINAKYVLEIGTLFGYSAIGMALALPEDGKVITLELESEHAQLSRKNIEKAGLTHKIEVIEGRAIELLPDMINHLNLDFVFLDADKHNYYKYVKILDECLRVGGMITADNAFAFGFVTSTAPERSPEDVKSIRLFNQFMNNWDKYFTTISPVGDGLLMSLKLHN